MISITKGGGVGTKLQYTLPDCFISPSPVMWWRLKHDGLLAMSGPKQNESSLLFSSFRVNILSTVIHLISKCLTHNFRVPVIIITLSHT